MSYSPGNQVEVVVINWKRPDNVTAIVQALRDQSVPCTITICDCHDSAEFELSTEAEISADRIYRWEHNLGAFSRYVPLGAYDHEYTFFVDDDMLPGRRCVEHFLAWAGNLRAFAALGQLGRIVDADGTYRADDVARGPGFTEVDILVRALFVPTQSLVHALQARTVLQAIREPEDDILLAVALAMYAGLRCYLTPLDPNPETLVNLRELPSPYALSSRPTHEQVRSQLTRKAVSLGWRPLRSRQRPEAGSGTSDADGGESRGVLYLALGFGYRHLTIASVSALRRYGYRGPVRVVTDDASWVPPALDCDVVVVPDVGDGFSTRHYKTRMHEFGYDTTLYLDSDAIPIADIGGVWNCLNDSDLAMAADLRPTVGALIAMDAHMVERRAEFNLMIRLGLTSRVHFNSGVIAFRRSAATAAVFSAWHEEWLRFGRLDQLALVRAVALTDPKVRTLSVTWNCPAGAFASIRAARDAGFRVLHFLSGKRWLMTTQLASAIADIDGHPADGDWERQNLFHDGHLPALNGSSNSDAHVRSNGGGFLVQAVNGSADHFEMVLPAARGGVECYWRECDANDHSWSEPVSVGQALGAVESAGLVLSTRQSQPTIELVARSAANLAHYWRASAPHAAWQGPTWLAGGVAGNPSLVHRGDEVLELVVPLAGGGIAHYRRDGGSDDARWSEPTVFGLELGRVDAVALTHSAQGADETLQVIVRKDRRLAHYWRPTQERGRWFGPVFFFEDAAGIPGFVEGANGIRGDLQALVPLARGGVAHLWRGPGEDWQVSTCIDRGGARVDAVSLVAADGHSRGRGDLEAVTVSGDDVTWYRRENGPFGNWTRVPL